MPVPVINPTTSVLGYRQWQPFEFQPYASNTPTGWSCSPALPAGLSLNTTTGKISGAASVAGVFNTGLVATNGAGDSTPLVLTIGIEEAPASQTNSGYEVEIDVVSRKLKFLSGDSLLSLFARSGNDLVLWIKFTKNGRTLDLDLVSLQLVLKEFEPDKRIVLGEAWHKYGSGTGTYYGLHASVSGAAVLAALSGYEADKGTEFDAIGEIRWEEVNANHSDFGPENFVHGTRNFPVTTAREMGQAA